MTVDSRYFWFYVSGIVVGRLQLQKICCSFPPHTTQCSVTTNRLDDETTTMNIDQQHFAKFYFIWLLYLKIQ